MDFKQRDDFTPKPRLSGSAYLNWDEAYDNCRANPGVWFELRTYSTEASAAGMLSVRRRSGFELAREGKTLLMRAVPVAE